MNFTGNVVLGRDLTIDSKATLADGSLSVIGSIEGQFALKLNSGTGTTTFTGDIGRAQPLVSLTTDVGGKTILRAGTISAISLNFNDAIELDGNVTLVADTFRIWGLAYRCCR